MSEQEPELAEPAADVAMNAENQNPSTSQNPPENATSQSDTDIIEVRLKTLQDRETRVSISKQRTIGDLIDAARADLAITTGNQRIIYQGRVFEPNHTIEAAGIENGHTVHIVDRPESSTSNSRTAPGPAAATTPPERQGLISERALNALRREERRNNAANEQRGPTQYMVLPPIRVPATIGGIPVISSRYDSRSVYEETLALRFRTDPPTPRTPRDSNIPPYSEDPHVITWTIKIVDNDMYFPREQLLEKVEDTIFALPFMDISIWEQSRVTWNEIIDELRIDLPQVAPHVASPALEKLDFMCFWTEILGKFLDKVNEREGLVDTVQQVILMAKRRATTDGLIQNRREQRIQDLDQIARELELVSSELTHMKDYERERFKKNNTPEYRTLKIQEYLENQRNPRFYMRHALDIDFTVASREFRKQQKRFSTLEEILDEMLDCGAMKYAREIMTSNRDYRYQAISMFYHYMQRMRHQVSHITHVQSELDVSFLTPNSPQRLLPQYSTNLAVPLSHATTLIFKLVQQREEPYEVPVTTIIEPPRLAGDVGNRVPGEWPYLSFNTPGVSLDAVLQTRRMEDPRLPRGLIQMHTEMLDAFNPQGIVMPGMMTRAARNVGLPIEPTTTIQDLIMAQHEHIEQIFAQNPGIDSARVRLTARPRRVLTTGDAPSIPVETMPPPVDWVATTNRRQPAARYNAPDRPGPETGTLQRLPTQIEQTELQRISRNIASRYREDALRRIAASLSARFNEESWDTRLQNMQLCTIRESIALCLELLSSSGTTLQESKDLMLALVRDEEVLVRAIAESIKSLFGRGEFPTHLARIIIPRNETAAARTDYEAVDGVEDAQADELETMVVRVPSDISQPQSGDLRAIRDRRASRRQFLENRGRIPSTSTAPANPPGPSFSAEDIAEIRAGRLPTSIRQPRRPARVIEAGPSPTIMPVQSAASTSTDRSLSPNQVLVQLTASVHPGQPSSSNATATVNINPIGFAATRVPMRQNPNLEGSSQLPESSPPIPRRSSAPATVTNSPIRGESSSTGVSNWEMSTNEASTQTSVPRPTVRPGNERARAARAQIDRLAANFTAPNTTHYLPGTWNPRTERTMPTPELSGINQRPMVAIDPFMVCGSRHCEIHRVQNPASLPDADRYSLQSLQPDPELDTHLAPIRPNAHRRPQQTPEDDEDYNYDVLRSVDGVLAFNDMDKFLQFIRTMCRSILSHAVDADSLISLNMTNVSGYTAANPQELMNMVRRHINLPYPATINNIPFRPTRPTPSRDARGHPRPESPIPDRNEIFRQVTERAADAPPREITRGPLVPTVGGRPLPYLPEMMRNTQRLNPGSLSYMQISANFTFIVDYMLDRRNPRPPGLFGMLLDTTTRHLTRHDFALLPRLESAGSVLMEYGDLLKREIATRYLEGRSGLDNAELQRLAEGIANTEEFFDRFISQNPSFRRQIELATGPNETENLSTARIFRQIEIALVKAILTTCQANAGLEPLAHTILDCFDLYLYRNFMVFWRLGNRDAYRQKQYMHRIPDYVATIRFDSPAGNRLEDFLDVWHQAVDYWFDKYQESDEADFTLFLRRVRDRSDHNDATELISRPLPYRARAPAPSSDSSSTSSASVAAPSASNAVIAPNRSPLRLYWTQICRFFQESAVTMAVVRAMTAWMWWRR